MFLKYLKLADLFHDIVVETKAKLGDQTDFKNEDIPEKIRAIVKDSSLGCTAVPADLIEGKTAYSKGHEITGTMPSRDASSISINDNRITLNYGYYPAGTHKDITTGVVNDPSVTATYDYSLSLTKLSIVPSVTYTEGIIGNGTKSGQQTDYTADDFVYTDAGKTSPRRLLCRSMLFDLTNIDVSNYKYVDILKINSRTLGTDKISNVAYLISASPNKYGIRTSVELEDGAYSGGVTTKDWINNIFPTPENEATANKIAYGYTLYDHNGTAVTGTVTSKSSQIYTASADADLTISSGLMLIGDQIFKKVELVVDREDIVAGKKVQVTSNNTVIKEITGDMPISILPTIVPSTSDLSIAIAGYYKLNIAVNKVSKSIDAASIKKDVHAKVTTLNGSGLTVELYDVVGTMPLIEATSYSPKTLDYVAIYSDNYINGNLTIKGVHCEYDPAGLLSTNSISLKDSDGKLILTYTGTLQTWTGDFVYKTQYINGTWFPWVYDPESTWYGTKDLSLNSRFMSRIDFNYIPLDVENVETNAGIWLKPSGDVSGLIYKNGATGSNYQKKDDVISDYPTNWYSGGNNYFEVTDTENVVTLYALTISEYVYRYVTWEYITNPESNMRGLEYFSLYGKYIVSTDSLSTTPLYLKHALGTEHEYVEKTADIYVNGSSYSNLYYLVSDPPSSIESMTLSVTYMSWGTEYTREYTIYYKTGESWWYAINDLNENQSIVNSYGFGVDQYPLEYEIYDNFSVVIGLNGPPSTGSTSMNKAYTLFYEILEYDETKVYNLNSYCMRDYYKYRCLSDGVTGTWDDSKWTYADDNYMYQIVDSQDIVDSDLTYKFIETGVFFREHSTYASVMWPCFYIVADSSFKGSTWYNLSYVSNRFSSYFMIDSDGIRPNTMEESIYLYRSGDEVYSDFKVYPSSDIIHGLDDVSSSGGTGATYYYAFVNERADLTCSYCARKYSSMGAGGTHYENEPCPTGDGGTLCRAPCEADMCPENTCEWDSCPGNTCPYDYVW